MVSRVYNESSMALGRGPSKKNDGETSSALASSNRRLTGMQQKPASYFWIIWNDRPTATPRFHMFMPRRTRR